MDVVRTLNDLLQPRILLENTYLFAVLSIFLGVYGPRLHIRLPSGIRNLFSNVFFRAFVIFLVVYMADRDMGAALTIVIIFMVMMNVLNTVHVFETTAEAFNNYGPAVASCENYKQGGNYPLHAESQGGELNGANQLEADGMYAKPL